MGSSDKVVIYVVVGVLLVCLVGIFVLTSRNSASKQQYAFAQAAAQAAAQAGGHPAMTLSPDGDIVLNNMYSQSPGPGGPAHQPGSPGSPGGRSVGDGGGPGSKPLTNQRSEVFGKLAASILNDEPTVRSGHGTASVVTISETGL